MELVQVIASASLACLAVVFLVESVVTSAHRMHPGEEIPDWVAIYFLAVLENKTAKCNLCELEIEADVKSPVLLDHIKKNHKDIYDLHKDNPEASVGFRVEFLNINVLKDGDCKVQPVYLSEVTDPAIETEIQEVSQEPEDDVINMQYVMLDTSSKRKYVKKTAGSVPEQRKRSWIWKYFDKLSNIIYRCNICNVVLSIKGCNTNNLNRHMRSRHPESYKTEKFGEMPKTPEVGELVKAGSESAHAAATEEIYASGRDVSLSLIDSPSQKMRRSWIWSYFDHVSSTQAQCKLCHRQIQHGGNATGNMNRHLKMIHHKTSIDNSWVWKVFEKDDANFTCRICQQILARNDSEVDMVSIMYHLKQEHGVESGDQIITGTDCLETTA